MQLSEFQLLEKFGQVIVVRGTGGQGQGIEHHGRSRIDRNQVAAQQGLFPEGYQVLVQFLFGHGIDLSVKFVDGTIRFDEVDGRFGSHPGDAGNIVGRIPGKAHHLDHLFGGDPMFLRDKIDIDDLVFHGIPDGMGGGHQLHEILVPGHHDHVEAGLAGLARQGADQIIGLIAGHFEGRNLEPVHDLPDPGELEYHILGHGGPVGLVFRVYVVAEGGAFHVETDRQVLGIFILHQLDEHARKTEHGIGGHPL